MNRRNSRTKTAKKKIPPPPGPDATYEELIAYHCEYTMAELEEAGYLKEPSPEEIRELEESAERHLEREKAKGLAAEYPRANRTRQARWTALLSRVPGLKAGARKDIAIALNVIVDRARDLEEIADRLLQEKHTPAEVAELLYAFDTMVQYIRSYSDSLGAKLLEIFDRLKRLTPSNPKMTLGAKP